VRQLTWIAAGVLLAAALVAAQSRPTQPKPAPSRPTRPAARPAAPPPTPYGPGERLVYDITWSGMLTAGTITVTTHDRRPSFGSTAFYMTAEGRPTGFVAALYPVYYKADTLLDTTTLLPHQGSLYSDEKGRRRYRLARFDQAARSVHYEFQSLDPMKVLSQSDLPATRAHDALSVVFALRTMALSPGASTLMPVVVNGHVYQVLMKVDGRERVRSGLGDLDAWRLTPTLVDERDREDGRDMAIWISADARRLPLKLQGQLPVGAFVLSLSAATAGSQAGAR
jgi:Protein of unknown function (DUF3108)